jgi:hypothetical protein
VKVTQFTENSFSIDLNQIERESLLGALIVIDNTDCCGSPMYDKDDRDFVLKLKALLINPKKH